MSVQKLILNQYMEINNNPPLRVISEQTGIQITRVFRLLNGSQMKLYEYVAFDELIQKQLGMSEGLESLIKKCKNKLSKEGLLEIENYLTRKLNLWDLVQNNTSLKMEARGE